MYYDLNPKTGEITQAGGFIQGATRFHMETQVREYRISTVFLCLDHSFSTSGPPILFETLIFGPENSQYDQEMERYCTLKEAKNGHIKWVNRVKGLKSTLAKL